MYGCTLSTESRCFNTCHYCGMRCLLNQNQDVLRAFGSPVVEHSFMKHRKGYFLTWACLWQCVHSDLLLAVTR